MRTQKPLKAICYSVWYREILIVKQLNRCSKPLLCSVIRLEFGTHMQIVAQPRDNSRLYWKTSKIGSYIIPENRSLCLLNPVAQQTMYWSLICSHDNQHGLKTHIVKVIWKYGIRTTQLHLRFSDVRCSIIAIYRLMIVKMMWHLYGASFKMRWIFSYPLLPGQQIHVDICMQWSI